MKLVVCLMIILLPTKYLWASHIFHLEKSNQQCEWKLYNVEKARDKAYFKTKLCPDQIVWLKDKSFYYSIKGQVYWANQWSKKPLKIVDLKTASKGYHPRSETIWGVKGKYNSIYTMVIDPKLKSMKVNGTEFYEYNGKAIDPETFSGSATELKAAGVIRRWLKKAKKWKTVKLKLVGRYNNNGFDEDLYNMSVLSSRQITHYNECGGSNCERLPANQWNMEKWESKLRFIDDGIQSVGYLQLSENRGVLFKKSLGEKLHPIKPFILCEDNCEKMTELELPKSFSDNFAMVKKGSHLLVTNEDKGSLGSLYSFNSAKPIKRFKGPMVFWHPF